MACFPTRSNGGDVVANAQEQLPFDAKVQVDTGIFGDSVYSRFLVSPFG
jgi:hypothetical protein